MWSVRNFADFTRQPINSGVLHDFFREHSAKVPSVAVAENANCQQVEMCQTEQVAWVAFIC